MLRALFPDVMEIGIESSFSTLLTLPRVRGNENAFLFGKTTHRARRRDTLAGEGAVLLLSVSHALPPESS